MGVPAFTAKTAFPDHKPLIFAVSYGLQNYATLKINRVTRLTKKINLKELQNLYKRRNFCFDGGTVDKLFIKLGNGWQLVNNPAGVF